MFCSSHSLTNDCAAFSSSTFLSVSSAGSSGLQADFQCLDSHTSLMMQATVTFRHYYSFSNCYLELHL